MTGAFDLGRSYGFLWILEMDKRWWDLDVGCFPLYYSLISSSVFLLQQSLCSEMAEELRFAIRCHGPSKRPKYKTRMCLKCKMLHEHSLECPLSNMNRREAPNGVIQMQDKSRTNCNISRDARDFELDYLHDPCAEFGAGGYLHVEYSDTDT